MSLMYKTLYKVVSIIQGLEFFRGSCKIVQESEGSGVGLYLTSKILEEQGGSIMVDSKLGKGSKFSLFLQKCK